VKAPGHYISKGFRAVRYGEELLADDVCSGKKFWGDVHMLPLSEARTDLIGKTIRLYGFVGCVKHSELKNRIVRKKTDTVAPAQAKQLEIY
jgi:hypothetical protein